jgi:hypothetical protein
VDYTARFHESDMGTKWERYGGGMVGHGVTEQKDVTIAQYYTHAWLGRTVRVLSCGRTNPSYGDSLCVSLFVSCLYFLCVILYFSPSDQHLSPRQHYSYLSKSAQYVIHMLLSLFIIFLIKPLIAFAGAEGLMGR